MCITCAQNYERHKADSIQKPKIGRSFSSGYIHHLHRRLLLQLLPLGPRATLLGLQLNVGVKRGVQANHRLLGMAHSSLQWGKHQRRGTWVCHSSTGRAPSLKLVIPLNRRSSMYINTCQETLSFPHSPLSRFPGHSEDCFITGGPPCPLSSLQPGSSRHTSFLSHFPRTLPLPCM